VDRRVQLGWVRGTPAERRAFGQRLRNKIRRVDQCKWNSTGRSFDPIGLIRSSHQGRIEKLIRIKEQHMAASPFSFFRGAAPLMAADLARMTVTGLRVQMCGDTHVRNLGAYAAPDGLLVFDLNDFDETIPGPWEWDLKRLAASFVLNGQEAGNNSSRCHAAVLALVRAYRQAMDHFAAITVLDLSRHLTARSLAKAHKDPVQALLAKAARADP
jgi:uncharacterized protein (DUF2252 family)